jgi:predicted acylesterase/phospholipase RssA
MKRALILAGGGAKIGWASGALQVLLEEAGLRFDHYDATSGSVFNLGMLLSGRSAAHICEAWAELSPYEMLSFHPALWYLSPWKLPSLLTQRAVRDRIMPKWGIELHKIRECREVYGHPCSATFNVLDFNQKRVKALSSTELDQDYFLAVDAVPGLVPPVVKSGTLYTDAMLLTDANLLGAVERGADELWVLWTAEDSQAWRGGFWNHLGHMFEACALGNLRRELDQIEAMNQRIARNEPRPGDRPITVHLLAPDEPIAVDYMMWPRRHRMAEVIDSGRRWTRRYLEKNGFLRPSPAKRTPKPGSQGLSFTETMKGYWTRGERDHERGLSLGEHALNELEVTLTIDVDDMDEFIANPEHEASIRGVVRSPSFEGTCAVIDGSFKLFVQNRTATREMRYELDFLHQGRPLTLRGFKTLRNDLGLDLWADTTTLYVDIVEHGSTQSLGSGVIKIELLDFLEQLTTIRGRGRGVLDRAAALAAFGKFFIGGLWQEYALPAPDAAAEPVGAGSPQTKRPHREPRAAPNGESRGSVPLFR